MRYSFVLRKENGELVLELDELLEKFYNQEIEMDDLLDFSLDISLGDMGFSAIAKTDEEIERLRK